MRCIPKITVHLHTNFWEHQMYENVISVTVISVTIRIVMSSGYTYFCVYLHHFCSHTDDRPLVRMLIASPMRIFIVLLCKYSFHWCIAKYMVLYLNHYSRCLGGDECVHYVHKNIYFFNKTFHLNVFINTVGNKAFLPKRNTPRVIYKMFLYPHMSSIC